MNLMFINEKLYYKKNTKEISHLYLNTHPLDLSQVVTPKDTDIISFVIRWFRVWEKKQIKFHTKCNKK